MSAVASRRVRPIALQHGRKHFRSYIKPCDPTPRSRPPSGKDWLYEIKADGYRAQVHLADGQATVYSRNGLDWSNEFSSIALAAQKIKAKQAIFDGEAVVYGKKGLPDFQALRREIGKKDSSKLLYQVFDVLFLNDRDVRREPYWRRKAILRDLLKRMPQSLVYVDYINEDGSRVFSHACKMGLEGVVAKRRDSIYRSGRSEDWVKLKCKKSETFPIVAFVEKLGARPRKIASLYVGKHEKGKLVYAGKLRTGYTEAIARELRERLDPLVVWKSPL